MMPGLRGPLRGPLLAALVALVLVPAVPDAAAQEVKCGHPAVPVNARVSLSSEGLGPNTVATYTCDPGYELFGAATTSCSSSGRWQGELPFCGTNVALRKPANQSTTVRGGAAGNANDGDLSTVHDGRLCTETQREPSPWWRVDLLRPYPVRTVRITTRGCCGHQPLQDLEIRVGNSSHDLQRNPLCAWFPGTMEEGVTKMFSCARALVGQYVFLQLVGVEGSLSLCEVQVFTSEEFSDDRCAPAGGAADTELAAFDRVCFELAVKSGGSFEAARSACRAHGGDLVHGLSGARNLFLLAELERRKQTLKTQLVWIGAQKDPGVVSRTWRWVDGEVVVRPAWGKDQPNNYNGEQNCAVLDGGRGWLWNDVGCNLDYLHWVCMHMPSSCGSPDKLVNTTVVGSNHSVHAVISYRCPEGHMLVGSANRTCAKDGFWTGEAPSCMYVDCGGVTAPENGAVNLLDGRTTHGAAARYSCNLNYTLIGQERRTCGDGGKWTGDQPKCLFDWCGEPPAVHGGFVETSGRRAGSIATYSCQPGFILFGTGVVSCGLGGEWSGKAPQCKYVDCGAPPIIDNGHYRLLNGSTTYGSSVEYVCDQDYWLEPENQARQLCTREGKWSGVTPSCEKITCGEPEVPGGGYVVGIDYNVHSSIEYHCDPGHVLRGEPHRQCMNSGDWSGEAPACEYVDCGKVPTMLYGSAHYANSTTYLGSVITYSCVRNYRLVGVQSRQCQESGQWSDGSPRCEEIRCPEPVLANHRILTVTNNDRQYGRTLIRTAENAASSSTTTYKIGALAKYQCERGYKVVGETLSTCEDNGQWSGEVPQCIFVDCAMPQPTAHGRFTLASNMTYYGAAAIYECDENYELDGHARRLCMENGTWSSDTPVCREIMCPELQNENGITVQVSTRSIGGVAHYQCPRGQFMEGNSTRICLKRGRWSSKIPKCSWVDCKHPGPIENGRVIVMNDTTTYNSAVEYHCIPHFERVGPYLRKCMEDGQWSGEEPTCQLSTGEASEAQNLGLPIGIGAGVLLFLLLVLGLIYLRLRKERPIKNTENVQAALRKEDQNAAVMSFSTLNDGTNGGVTHLSTNIYENIHDHTDNMYDAPYEETERRNGNHHYEASPVSRPGNGATVTINGVAVR
ncbi:sushi, von Willebrand factor type A, EGF and pentraxin domain-containing protein 1 [Thrips palmi]|uniref:Sushi, von Willebrand factor type A, EGF and pentraxin domain-containing protein 1 n=1 Tax=Thrips palmi TaxID=161013 RepID=A0A6P8Y685_THRPL|nr:sushi, von Willebrand factor type A, EGF and pentraxin domain-containing protein 1 [Thrips palmi]